MTFPTIDRMTRDNLPYVDCTLRTSTGDTVVVSELVDGTLQYAGYDIFPAEGVNLPDVARRTAEALGQLAV
jgi:hypothetical protein